jgi:Flp pilus assembly pilin Flp
MIQWLGRFIRGELGQDLIEYGLLVGLITAVIVATITTLGTKILGYYSSLCTNLGGC